MTDKQCAVCEDWKHSTAQEARIAKIGRSGTYDNGRLTCPEWISKGKPTGRYIITNCYEGKEKSYPFQMRPF